MASKNEGMTAFCLRLLFALLAFAPLAAEIEQATPEETHTDHFFTELLNMASTLGLVLLGLLIITWLLKRTVSARVEQLNVTSAIKILERRSLAPKVAVYILEIWGTRLIVGETPAGLVRLGELPAEAGKFAQLLKEQPP